MTVPLAMASDHHKPPGFSLKRWSQRKLEAARATPSSPPAPVSQPPTALPSSASAAATPADAVSPDAGLAESPLPPIESLHYESSDFTAFMRPQVDSALKRQALKKLLQDPRFNVMDGLDTYIADYSLPDPIAPEVVRQMVQARYIFDPPQTRINAAGHVEDVPPEELVKSATDARAAAEASLLPPPPDQPPPLFAATPETQRVPITALDPEEPAPSPLSPEGVPVAAPAAPLVEDDRDRRGGR